MAGYGPKPSRKFGVGNAKGVRLPRKRQSALMANRRQKTMSGLRPRATGGR